MSATRAIYNPESAVLAFDKSPNGVSVAQNLHWYCIHTKIRQEDRAAKNLIAWGMETISPELPRKHPNFFRALFPRYIFAKLHLPTVLRKLEFTRGVNSVDYIVSGMNGEPAIVDAEIIKVIKQRMDAQGIIRSVNDFKQFEAGDHVRITSGPWQDFCGVFEKESGTERAIILLNAILRTKVEMPFSEIVLDSNIYSVVRA